MHLLRVYRLQQGLKIGKLADLAGVTPRIITDLERRQDYNIHYKTMKKLSRALGLPTSMIFFPEEEMETRKLYSKFFVHFLKVMEAQGMLEINKRQTCPYSSFDSKTTSGCEA